MVFDIVLYTAAIVTVLALFGGRKAPATRPARQVLDTLETLHAIGEALPDECFAVEATAGEISTIVEVGAFDSGSATAEESALVDAAWQSQQPAEVDEFADLLTISAPRAIDARWLATYGTHALRTLGVVEGITGARRWAKAQAVEVLAAHYAAA